MRIPLGRTATPGRSGQRLREPAGLQVGHRALEAWQAEFEMGCRCFPCCGDKRTNPTDVKTSRHAIAEAHRDFV